jgi:CheY-like chemotaxis protein
MVRSLSSVCQDGEAHMAKNELHTIHFIDDSPDEFLITRLSFRRSKIDTQIDAHPDFESFLEHIKDDETFTPSTALVISDLNLGTSSGLDAVRAVRSNPAMADVMIGICSGSDDPADRKAAKEANADFFVTKPLNQQAIELICEAIPRLELVIAEDGRAKLHVDVSD